MPQRAPIPVFPNGKPMLDVNGEPVSRSRLAAALLCWFLGIFGVHRFYVGKVGTGVLMLITLGALGVWALIDSSSSSSARSATSRTSASSTGEAAARHDWHDDACPTVTVLLAASLAAAVLALTSCTSGGDVPMGTSPPPSTAGAPTSSDPAALALVERLAEAAVVDDRLRGLIVRATRDGAVVAELARGESLPGVPATPDMTFRNGRWPSPTWRRPTCGSPTRACSASTTPWAAGCPICRWPTR
jgi:hypothetical protein